MKALRVEKKKLAVREIEKPGSGVEALVRVLLSGICSTDLEIARGYAGFKGTIGHEFVGVVEEAPDRSMVGRRVVGEINAGCGKCELCRAGDARHCQSRTVLGIVGRDGAHAEFLRLPAGNLLAVPDNVLDEHAVFTEPLAAACGIMERVTIESSHRVAIIGDGKLGLLCAQEISMVGSRCGRFQPALDLLKKGAIDIDSLISEEYPLARSLYAMERAGKRGVLKVLLRP